MDAERNLVDAGDTVLREIGDRPIVGHDRRADKVSLSYLRAQASTSSNFVGTASLTHRRVDCEAGMPNARPCAHEMRDLRSGPSIGPMTWPIARSTIVLCKA